MQKWEFDFRATNTQKVWQKTTLFLEGKVVKITKKFPVCIEQVWIL